MLVRNSGLRLFWGDLHAQSQYHCWCETDQIGISSGTPEDLYHYAHDVAGLDFCAITDTGSICSDIWTRVSKRRWRLIGTASSLYSRAAKWATTSTGIGTSCSPPNVPSRVWNRCITTSGMAGLGAHRAQTLYRGRDDVMLVYHHTKMWNNWSRWDPSMESLLEIYSSWGSGEKGEPIAGTWLK